MTLSQLAFVAFSGAILIGVAVFAVVWTYGPQRRFRVVNRSTGEVVSHHWTSRAAVQRADLLSWSAPLVYSRPHFLAERVR